ncbi:hypothetical protein KDL29_09215 [bacterium]|nr:hypothetical protein [bacterium]
MLNFLKGKGPGSNDFPKDPATMGAPYIQAREFVDGHTEFIAWTCHPSLMLDERSTRIPQVIDAEGQSFTPQMGALENGTEIPRFESLEAAERAIRLYSENQAKRSIVREDLLSAELIYLEERLGTLRGMLDAHKVDEDALPESFD